MEMKTRLLKATCKHGYTIRISAKWMKEGTPRCPQGHPLYIDASSPSTAASLDAIAHNFEERAALVNNLFKAVRE